MIEKNKLNFKNKLMLLKDAIYRLNFTLDFRLKLIRVND